MLRDSLSSVCAKREAYHRGKLVSGTRVCNNGLHTCATQCRTGNPSKPGQNGGITSQVDLRDVGSRPMANPVTVPAIKVTVPLKPTDLPADLVPAEPLPTGNPVLTVQLQGTGVIVPVHLSGKNARKTTKLIAQHGADSVNLVINGNLKPGPNGTWLITEASFQTFIKTQAAPGSGPDKSGTSATEAATASNLTQPPK